MVLNTYVGEVCNLVIETMLVAFCCWSELRLVAGLKGHRPEQIGEEYHVAGRARLSRWW